MDNPNAVLMMNILLKNPSFSKVVLKSKLEEFKSRGMLIESTYEKYLEEINRR